MFPTSITMGSPYKIMFSPLLSNLVRITLRRFVSHNSLSSSSNTEYTEAEKRIIETLERKFHDGKIHVADVSGGCGAMYDVTVISSQFQGMSLVRQHKLVTEILKDEIKVMHGLRILTRVPSDDMNR